MIHSFIKTSRSIFFWEGRCMVESSNDVSPPPRALLIPDDQCGFFPVVSCCVNRISSQHPIYLIVLIFVAEQDKIESDVSIYLKLWEKPGPNSRKRPARLIFLTFIFTNFIPFLLFKVQVVGIRIYLFFRFRFFNYVNVKNNIPWKKKEK